MRSTTKPCDIVARVHGDDAREGTSSTESAVVPAPSQDVEVIRLRAEVRLLRDELAAIRRNEEKRESRLAAMRAARNRAQKAAEVLSESLAERLRVDGTLPVRRRSLLSLRNQVPSAAEAPKLELIRASPLFDAAWYLRQYHDVVRSGEEPALHFLRHPTGPVRAPGPDFDTARYLDAHPDVRDGDENPLVHYLLTEEGRRGVPYPPPT